MSSEAADMMPPVEAGRNEKPDPKKVLEALKQKMDEQHGKFDAVTPHVN